MGKLLLALKIAWPFAVFVGLSRPIGKALEYDAFMVLTVLFTIWIIGQFVLFLIGLLLKPKTQMKEPT